MSEPIDLGKTVLKRAELYRDRWSSFGADTGILEISERLTPDQLRELEIFEPYDDSLLEKMSPDVSIAAWGAGSVLFEEGAYIDLAFFIISGEVDVFLQGVEGETKPIEAIFESSRTQMLPRRRSSEGTASLRTDETRLMRGVRRPSQITLLATMDFDLARGEVTTLGTGELFGEIGAMSGWPQSVTAKTRSPCRLVQIRLPALRLMKGRSKALKARLDALYRERSLSAQLQQTPAFRECPPLVLDAINRVAELISCRAGEVVVREGEAVDGVYVVRSGFVKLAQRLGEGQMAVSYLSKGMMLGDVEIAAAELDRWEVTASSVEHSELVKIPLDVLEGIFRMYPEIKKRLWRSGVKRLKEVGFASRNIGHSEFTEVALARGLVQGNSILAIDLDVCTRCDDCVRACEATHGGRARFIREGNKYDNLLIAKSCYHCHDPVCLVGCPTGAIHRAGQADVVEIDDEICIGCNSCAINCPYDAIVMHDTAERWPGDMIPTRLRGKERLLASKCDLCSSTSHGPACVSNCPQGCAYRVGSLEEFQGLLKRRDRPEASPRLGIRKLDREAKGWLAATVASLVACAGVFAANAFFAEVRSDSAWGLGYGIAATVLMLAALLLAWRRRAMSFASRRRLGRPRSWLHVHIYGGLLFMVLTLMHAGFRLPAGLVTRSLLGLSLATVASGLLGVLLQKWIPRALASGLSNEVLQDRAVDLVADIRRRAEELIRTCSDPVKAAYAKQMAPILERPNRRLIYFIDITGGIESRQKDFRYLRGFLGEEERSRLQELQELLRAKLEIDAHCTLQHALRVWLWTHVPVSLLLVAFLVLHLYSVWRW